MTFVKIYIKIKRWLRYKKQCRKFQPPEYSEGRTNITDDRQSKVMFGLLLRQIRLSSVTLKMYLGNERSRLEFGDWSPDDLQL